MRVLILRPEPGNAATAAAVQALGMDPVRVPLFDIEPVAWDAPGQDDVDAVVMTSANAARHGGERFERFCHLPLFAVGAATARAACTAGFAHVVEGPADAAALVPLIRSHGAVRLLHLAGEEAPLLRADGSVVTRRIVYRSAVRDLDDRERDALMADVALIHSPRAGVRLAALHPRRSRTRLVAISAAAAAAAGGGWADIAIADQPRDEAMLALARRLCEAMVAIDHVSEQ